MSLFSLHTADGPVGHIAEPTAVTLGVFDGVHLGHRHLIDQLRSAAPTLAPLAVTLTTHPSFVLGRKAEEQWLDDPDEHRRLLFDAGARYVAELAFTAEVAQMTACQMTRLMHEALGMRLLLLGYDGRFGNRRNDDFGQLPQLAQSMGIELRQGMPFLLDGEPISSSRIRRALSAGDMEEASRLLGHPYRMESRVLHGRGVGHTLGFPTANIDLSATRKTLPKEGVYAVRMKIPGSGPLLPGMANLGSAPTFGVEQPLLEVHLLDYHGDLYGATIQVEFLHRLRDTLRFDHPDALRAQLENDLKQARQWL